VRRDKLPHQRIEYEDAGGDRPVAMSGEIPGDHDVPERLLPQCYLELLTALRSKTTKPRNHAV
jgi:hypothetical protein